MTITARLVTITSASVVTIALACDASQSSNNDSAGPTTLDGGNDDDGGSTASADDNADDDTGSGGGPGGDPSGGPADSGSGGDDGGEVMIDPENLIDDLEDGDAVIYARNGRQGAWYTYNDASVGSTQNPEAMTSFTPTDGGAPSSPLFMAHTDGVGFIDWGFGMGIDLNNAGDDMGGPGMRMIYDASGTSGIVFRARGDVSMRVKVLVDAIVPMDSGGSCAEMCEDAHGKLVPLTADWTQYQIGFDEMFQEGWGFGEVTLDPATLMSLQFQVAKNSDGMVEIDDLGFY